MTQKKFQDVLSTKITAWGKSSTLYHNLEGDWLLDAQSMKSSSEVLYLSNL